MYEKAASVKRLDAVLGKVNLPNWCFIVVRHGGHAHRGVFLLSCAPQNNRRRPLPTLPQKLFSMVSPVGIQFTYNGPSGTFSLGLSSAGVAPLPPHSRKILEVTVKTFAVFVVVPSRLRRQLHVVRAN